MILALTILAAAPVEDLELRVKETFEESCTMCHDESDDTFALDLNALAALRERTASTGAPMLVPGDPEGSYLYQKVIGGEAIEGELMPLDEDPLPAEELTAVRDWIAALGSNPPPNGGPAEGADASVGEVVEHQTADGEKSEPEKSEPEKAREPSAPAPVTAVKKRPKQPFFGTHQINLQSTTTLGRNVLAYRIHHRFGKVGGFGDRGYLGLAGGVVMSMGMEYGVLDGLDLLLRWTNSKLGWELGTKYVPIRQEDGKMFSFGLFASAEALTAFSVANRYSGNFQAMMSRLWFERWSTQLTLGYSMFTNHDESVKLDLGEGEVPVRDRRGTLNMGLASTLWLGKKRKHGIDLEYVVPIPDGGDPNAFYYHGGDTDPEGSKGGSWALGWSAKTGYHLFQVFVTNTRNIHTGLAAPGGDTKNPFKPFGDFFFGFNLSRKWKL